MCDFALIMCRPSSRVMYASGLPLEYEALKPLSPLIALGGYSWSVHPVSLLPLSSSQDGSMGVMGTQLISTLGTCRKWPAVRLPLMLVVRRYACTHDVPYGQKFWRRIYFGGLAVLRAIRQYFHPPNFLQYAVIRDVINMSSTIVQNVRTKASNFERMERN